MRTLLSTVACLVFILIAGMPSSDVQWYLALLGCAAVLLLRALSEREHKAEQDIHEQVFWSNVVDAVSSAERKREGPRADRD